MTRIRRVILFGGQGSPSLFSQHTVSTATDDARSSPAAAILVSRCHAAFLEDVLSLGTARAQVFGDETDFFTSPEKLLAPGAVYHDNPIIQSTTICLYQLLRYISSLTQARLDIESASRQTLEIAGFCSGLLPATVVALSNSVEEYIDFGVKVFHVAFWTGYRVTLHGQKTAGHQWKDFPWSLVVTGLNKDQMQEELEKFRYQVRRPINVNKQRR